VPPDEDSLPEVSLQLTEEELRRTDGMRSTVYQQTRELLQQIAPASWLDFGCGAGSLLARNQDIGVSYGYDHDPLARERALRQGLCVYDTWEQTPEVDCIVALDVIEHMTSRDLMAWLGRWHRKLLARGHLLIATANPECVTVWCEFWHDPTHVRPYTPSCLTSMARGAGFEQETLTLRRMSPRRRLSLRFVQRILRGLDILPPLGGEFDRYWVTYRKCQPGGE
jgi:hypothetical protein